MAFSRFQACVLLCLALAPARAFAQSAEKDVSPIDDRPQQTVGAPAPDDAPDISEELDLSVLLAEPVVTATRGMRASRALAPANVVSFSRDEILRRGFRSVAEVLSNTLGLYVTDDQVQPSIAVRGVSGGLRSGTRIVKVMINGVTVGFRPDLTAFIGRELIPIDQVESIEIAKGPLSALYGANAFLATVNIITRNPNQGVSGDVTGEGRLTNNRYGGYAAGMRLAYGSEKVDLTAAVAGADINRSGLTIDKTFNAQSQLTSPFLGQTSHNDTTSPRSAFTTLAVRDETLGNFTAQAGRQALDASAQFQPGSVLTPSRIALNNDFVSANWEKKFSDTVKLRLNGGYSRGGPTDHEILYTTGPRDFSYQRNFNYHAVDLGGAADFELPWNISLTLGTDYVHDRETVLFYTQTANFSSSTQNPGDQTQVIGNQPRHVDFDNFGAYAQAATEIVPGLHLTGNFRYDKPQYFDSQLSWRAAVAYEWSSRLVTKAFFGRAFQTPSPVMLFAVPGFGDQFNVIGNRNQISLPHLNVQSVLSAELMMYFAATPNLIVEASAFAQQVDDKLEFVQLANDYTPRNFNDARSLGGELTAKWTSFRLDAAVAGTTQLNQIAPVGTAAGAPPAVSNLKFDATSAYPQFYVLANTTVRVPEVYSALNLNLRVVGQRGSTSNNTLLNGRNSYTLPAYATLDVTLSSIGFRPFGDKTLFVALSARNALNHRYNEPGFGGFDLPQLGRTWMLVATQSL